MSTLSSEPLSEQPPPPPPPPPRAAVRRPPLRRSWFCFLAALLALAAWMLAETPAQRDLRRATQHLASILAKDGENGVPVTTTLRILKGEGLPKQVANLQLEIAVAGPQHLWVSGQMDKERIELCRDGQRIWTWQPIKSFGLIAERGVPRFASSPATSRDDTRLGPMAWPANPLWLWVLPKFCQTAENGADEEVDGEKCRVLKAALRPQIAALVKAPSGTLTLWIRESDGWPIRLGYLDASHEVVAALQRLQVGQAIPESRWQMRTPPGVKVEHVALGHLKRFFHSALKLAGTSLPTLGPADGSRQVLATHGQGRLEMREGTRVLFLRGTPEEMGEQQGTLMRDQVRDLVDRVLYGVGVGSSFEKGRWFFGEIERCQARLTPFVDPRSLREMDAMAKAAGLAPEEIRLANFFPELFHCSGFALLGEATAGGRIYQGRILDYMKGIGLEANAVVTVNRPEQGHAWVNIGYAGFVGSVTAMNDQHISIGEMGGRGEGNWDGRPMAQLLREVMEKAGTLDEAIEIMRSGPRTCEYYYVIADGKNGSAVGLAATPDKLEVVHAGEAHPRLPTPVKDAVLLSAGDRYTELVRRVQAGWGKFDAASARDLMTRPVCMSSNIHSVLFAPDTLDFWVANADGKNVASATRYTHYNLAELLGSPSGAKP